MTPQGRLIALGASNLTRGFRVVTQLARELWGDPVEIVAALGHGRSYGMESAFLFRRLPGILDSGLWRHLDAAPEVNSGTAMKRGAPAPRAPGPETQQAPVLRMEGATSVPTRALLTDVGNDILYGAPVAEILGWVEECLRRLRALGAQVVMTDLPLASIDRLSSSRFLLFRSILVPSCPLSLAQVVDRGLAVEDGLLRLAEANRVAMVRLQPHWYGFDPIHIRPRLWGEAWREIFLGGEDAAGKALPSPRLLEWLRYYRAQPERQVLLGVTRERSQPALALPGGTAIHLF